MKHCVVTGGAGFIGSHLVEALLARGCRVSVIDDESTGSVENLAAVRSHPRLEYFKGSVADRQLVRHVVAEADEVFHLAAAVGVALIAKAPIRTLETNIYPTELLLSELAPEDRPRPPVKLFLASSSEVYGKNPKLWWDEDEDLLFGPTTRPRWSYGMSKAIDEFLALAYWKERGLPVVIGRFFNVVGPRQTGAYGMVLPRFVEAALSGGPLVVHDDGQQVRCFAHVADVVEAVLALMDTPAAVGRVFNIGSDQPIAILDLAKRVIAAVDPSLTIRFQSYAEAYSEDFEDCRCRVPDLGRLRATIDFRPRHSLDQIIHEVIAWKRASMASR
ncbi:MAG: NAD-dependent epimerase/dehydratase family protein [Thermoguttaceae bacterium]